MNRVSPHPNTPLRAREGTQALCSDATNSSATNSATHAYLFALLWLALCLAVCFTPSASLSRAALEEQRVAGALSLSKALAPADERLASLRRVSRAENDPSHHSPDSAPLTAFTAPLLLLPAWQGFALPRTIALAARHHPGAPRAPPLAQPFAV